MKETSKFIEIGSRSVYVGSMHEFAPSLRKWACDRGLSSVDREGDFNVVRWGLTDENVKQWVSDKIEKERATWPEEAKAACERLENMLSVAFGEAESAVRLSKKEEADRKSAESKSKHAEHRADLAEGAIAELQKRVRAADPDRIRRAVEVEFSDRTKKLEGEIQRLTARLNETESQVTKLSEDKRRLRAALNSARGK